MPDSTMSTSISWVLCRLATDTHICSHAFIVSHTGQWPFLYQTLPQPQSPVPLSQDGSLASVSHPLSRPIVVVSLSISLWHQLMHLLGSVGSRTRPCHPMTNSLTEHFHIQLKTHAPHHQRHTSKTHAHMSHDTCTADTVARCPASGPPWHSHVPQRRLKQRSWYMVLPCDSLAKFSIQPKRYLILCLTSLISARPCNNSVPCLLPIIDIGDHMFATT